MQRNIQDSTQNTTTNSADDSLSKAIDQRNRRIKKTANEKVRYENNKEKLATKRKANYEANKEVINAKRRAKYKTNEKEKAKNKARYEGNKEKIMAQQKIYRENHKEEKNNREIVRRKRKKSEKNLTEAFDLLENQPVEIIEQEQQNHTPMIQNLSAPFNEETKLRMVSSVVEAFKLKDLRAEIRTSMEETFQLYSDKDYPNQLLDNNTQNLGGSTISTTQLSFFAHREQYQDDFQSLRSLISLTHNSPTDE